VREPQTTAEWQAAVDAASALLHLSAAQAYGLIEGGPPVDDERCRRLLAEGKRRGIHPAADEVERFVVELHRPLRLQT
jgi:hypothetical protein